MTPRVVYYTASTLNGFLADTDDSLDWLFAIKSETQPDLEGFSSGIGVLVSGSTTYEWVLRNEDLIAHPEKWNDFYDGLPWFVFTSRELPVPDGADVRFVSGEVADSIDAISSVAGDKDIWLFGGGELVGQFFEAGLLAEIQVSFTPTTLSSGAPLLPRTIGSDRLRLESVEQFDQFAHLKFSVS